MGMSYTGFGAPVTTKNLKANADLDLGNYDLIATDVKGDTAEFDEFVGGVGNFDSVVIRGDIEAEGDITAAKIIQTESAKISSSASNTPSDILYDVVCILPPTTHKYNGSFIIKNTATSGASTIKVLTRLGDMATSHIINAGSILTINLSNSQCLYLGATGDGTWRNLAFGTLNID